MKPCSETCGRCHKGQQCTCIQRPVTSIQRPHGHVPCILLVSLKPHPWIHTSGCITLARLRDHLYSKHHFFLTQTWSLNTGVTIIVWHGHMAAETTKHEVAKSPWLIPSPIMQSIWGGGGVLQTRLRPQGIIMIHIHFYRSSTTPGCPVPRLCGVGTITGSSCS